MIWVTSTRELPEEDIPVVSTTAKWSLVSALDPFEFAIRGRGLADGLV